MALPAPKRCSEEGAEGWFTRPWTMADAEAYRAIGGWFISSGHQFDSKATARTAAELTKDVT